MTQSEVKRARPRGPSQKTREAAEWFREHGGTLLACMQKFGVTWGPLRRALVELYPDTPLPKRGSPLGKRGPSQKIREAAEWFREHGGTLHACSCKFDISVEALRRALMNLYPGIELPKRGAPPGRAKRRRSDGRVPRAAAKMYLEAGGRLSMRAVGRKFKISGAEVNKAVQRAKRSRRWKALGGAGGSLVTGSNSDANTGVIALASVDRAAARLAQGDTSAWEALVSFLAPIVLATPDLLSRAVRATVKSGRGDELAAACRDCEEQVAVICALGGSS